MPGSPPIRTTPPATRPPPSTRSNSSMPVGWRSTSVASISASVATASAGVRPRAGARSAAWRALSATDSTSVFQAPQLRALAQPLRARAAALGAGVDRLLLGHRPIVAAVATSARAGRKSATHVAVGLWLAFFVAAWAISFSPGPGAIAVMSASLNHGFARGYFATFGLIARLLDPAASSSPSASARVIATSALAFAVVKWLGVAYLDLPRHSPVARAADRAADGRRRRRRPIAAPAHRLRGVAAQRRQSARERPSCSPSCRSS